MVNLEGAFYQNKLSLLTHKKRLLALLLSFSLCLSTQAFAFEDVTEGKPFIGWLWDDQLRPTIEGSLDSKGMAIIASGAAAGVVAHQFDSEIYYHHTNPENRFMGAENGKIGGFLGSGGPGIAVALLQVYFDTENGLQHSRAIALTAANHILLAATINRQRPNQRDYLSLPSGHASSSFASATSLAYSYGWKVGVPAYAVATYIALSRVSENIHWLSDVTVGAALGIYWGRASALVTDERARKRNLQVMPIPIEGGALISASWEF